MKALLYGARLCAQHGWANTRVQLDSKLLVDMLKSGTNYAWSVSLEIEELKATNFWSISHCYREANRVVELLANVGCQSHISHVYWNSNKLPKLVFSEFKMDRLGMPIITKCKIC